MKRPGYFFGIISVILLFAPSISSAQYISVKQNFWGTLQYTRNGVDFKEFGGGWSNLLAETEFVVDAHRNILHSRNLNYAGIVFGIGGAVVLGYAAGKESRNDEVNDVTWIAGGSMALASLVCQLVAKHKLDKGLLAYNKHIGGYSSNKSIRKKFEFGFSGNAVAVSYYFW